jgi:NAD(P)-dependent dehydrogenase (short-subunit alcohol dehydrogenase family)
MTTRSCLALVTGANQNLGRALVAGLAARMTPADRVLLTGRDPARVGIAARELSAQIPDGAVIEPRVLDVRDPNAIRRLAADVGEVDIVFSNAAARMSPDDDPADAVDVIADTNNIATNIMLREFAPRIRDGGRFIIVASALGTLDKLPALVRPRFAAAAAADLDAVDRLVDEWRHSVKRGRAVREGFGTWLNIPSKVAQVAAVRAIARTRRSDDLQHGTLLMALCPGLIDTEASRPWFADMSSAQTPRAAATWPVDVALSDHFDPAYYGELVQFGTVLPWDRGPDDTSALARQSTSS